MCNLDRNVVFVSIGIWLNEIIFGSFFLLFVVVALHFSSLPSPYSFLIERCTKEKIDQKYAAANFEIVRFPYNENEARTPYTVHIVRVKSHFGLSNFAFVLHSFRT